MPSSIFSRISNTNITEVSLCFSKTVLVLVNINFLVVGTLIFAVGVIIEYAFDIVERQLPFDLDGLLDNVPSISQNQGMYGVTMPTQRETLDVKELLKSFTDIFIGLGFGLMVIGFTGTFGVCCNVKFFMTVYVASVGVLLLIMFIILGLILGGVFSNLLRNQLLGMLEEYIGLDDLTLSGIVWNFGMIYFECCGLDSYKDFENAKEWDPIRAVNYGGNFSVRVVYITPIACCKFNGTFPAIVPSHFNCSSEPTDERSNWKTGCFPLVLGEINKSRSTFMGCYAAVIVFQTCCGLVGGYVLYKKIKSNKVEGIDSSSEQLPYPDL